MMKKIATLAGVLALSLVAQQASAKVSAEEAAKLGKELTPIGAEKAGNKEGTIPAWSPLGQQGGLKDDWPKNPQFDAEKPLYTITKANMAQYADKLSEGQKAMLMQYPSFKMNVYTSVRTAFYPDAIYKATVENATRASLTGTDVIKGARLGFPFPIPKTGAEVIWNHKLKFRGSAVRRYNNQAIVKPDGSYTITKLIEDVKFKYANLNEQNNNDGGLFAFYLSEAISPPRVAGQITLVHETAGGEGKSRSAWIFSPGLGRVNRAPDVGYDNPAVGTDNEQFTDQIDDMLKHKETELLEV